LKEEEDEDDEEEKEKEGGPINDHEKELESE
jgi:hypothetical protein